MPGTYVLKHPTTKGSANPTAGEPWIYFLVERVTQPLTHKLDPIPRLSDDPKLRKKSKRERKITLIGIATTTDEAGLTGVRTSASDPTGTGKKIQEALETAFADWNAVGLSRLVIGTKDDATEKTYDGMIENITFDWNPAEVEDENSIRKFTLTFFISSGAL